MPRRSDDQGDNTIHLRYIVVILYSWFLHYNVVVLCVVTAGCLNEEKAIGVKFNLETAGTSRTDGVLEN